MDRQLRPAGQLRDVSGQGGLPFRAPLAARGAAFGDLDNDGRIDIAINCNDGPALILRNQSTPANHWLTLELVGSASNRDGLGAKVRLLPEGGPQQTAFISTAGSYISASDKRAHFGLGPRKKVERIEITWPSGSLQRLDSVAADQILTVREPSH